MSVLQEYKCPCCGGAVEFNSTVQKMKCPYCDSEFEMETLKAYDEELSSEQESVMEWQTSAGTQWSEGEEDSLNSYVCQSCGGEIICDATTVATSCPYCDNPVVMKGNVSGVLRPDYVIPFKYDKKMAKEQYNKHISGKRLLPKLFKDNNHIDEIKGMYVPVWLFDAGTDSRIRYKATRTRVWSDSSYNYTETSYYAVLRAGQVSFERVPVDGSEKMDDALMESIEPYDFTDAVSFQTAYLAGYLADKYDVDANSSIGRANERIKTSAEESFRQTVTGYATVVPESTYVKLTNSDAKYALYPVWILNTTYEGKKYTFAMNGQTGKFVGDLPVDKAAARRWFLALSGIVTGVVFGITYLIHLLF